MPGGGSRYPAITAGARPGYSGSSVGAGSDVTARPYHDAEGTAVGAPVYSPITVTARPRGETRSSTETRSGSGAALVR